MKKIIALILVIMGSFLFSGCNKESNIISVSPNANTNTVNNIDEGRDIKWVKLRKELLKVVNEEIQFLEKEGKIYKIDLKDYKKVKEFIIQNGSKKEVYCGKDYSNCTTLYINNLHNKYLAYIGFRDNLDSSLNNGELFFWKDFLNSKDFYTFVDNLLPPYNTPEKFKEYILPKFLKFQRYSFYIMDEGGYVYTKKYYIKAKYYLTNRKKFIKLLKKGVCKRVYIYPVKIDNVVYDKNLDYEGDLFQNNNENKDIVFVTYNKKTICAFYDNSNILDDKYFTLISSADTIKHNNHWEISLISSGVITDKYVGFGTDISDDGEKVLYPVLVKKGENGLEEMNIYINNRLIYTVTGSKLALMKASYNSLNKKFSFAISKGDKYIIVINEDTNNAIITDDLLSLAKIKNPRYKKNLLLFDDLSVNYNDSDNSLYFSNGYKYKLKDPISLRIVMIGFNKTTNELNVYYRTIDKKQEYSILKKLVFKIEKK